MFFLKPARGLSNKHPISHTNRREVVCFQGIVGMAVHYFLSMILPLYMSGEELIWEAAMMIF